jgi:hypothetical protein
MTVDLLQLADLEPPMGDLFVNRRLDAGRAVWTRQLAGEDDLPKKRIIHQRVVRLPGRAKLHRLGLRRGQGYHKCGSRQDLDWVTAFRVLAWQGGKWREVCARRNLAPQVVGAVQWFRLPRLETSGVIIELRSSGIDDGWTPWNLAMSACVLEGELIDPIAPRCEQLLRRGSVKLDRLPRGVTASMRDGEVRYRTKDFEVGFLLSRPGFSFFGLHTEDEANRGLNTLQTRPPQFFQGPQLHEVGLPPALAPVVRCVLDGECTVRGATVNYRFVAGGQNYHLVWRVSTSGLECAVERTAKKAAHAWHSAAWTVGLRNSVTPSHVLARLEESGESGALALPALLVLPRFGAWKVSSSSAAGWARSDCFRSRDLNVLELKVGEERTAEGLYRLPAGTHRAVFRLEPAQPASPLRADAPAVVRRALARTQWTALTLRADTATLSNNGASMHCPICLDTWSAVALPAPDVLPGLPAAELLARALVDRRARLRGGAVVAGRRFARCG